MGLRESRVGVAIVLLGLSAIPAVASATSATESEPQYGLLDRDALQVMEGGYRVRLDGSVIENLEIRGSLRIVANDVIVRNVWVYTEGPWTIYVEQGSATFEHVEIGHPDFIGERGIGGDNITARYLDIHHVEDGIKAGNDSLYEHIWVHDLDSKSGDPHADGLQDDGGATNFTIRNSILDSTGPLGLGNAAILIKSDLGPSDGIRVENNYLNGGAWMLYVRDGGHGFPSNVSVINNRFGPDYQFGLADVPGEVEWRGNVLHQTGQEISSDSVLGDAPAGYVPEPWPTPGATVPTFPPTTALTATTGVDAAPPVREGGGTNPWLLVVVGLGSFLIGVLFMRRPKTRS